MAKSLTSAVFIIISAILAIVASSSSPKEIAKWVENLTYKQEKVTRLHFYYHRIEGTTSALVAMPNVTVPPPTGFGAVLIKDDPLTLGPETSSTHIGYAQGMLAGSSLNDIVFSEYFTFYFTDPVYNGSTLSILGSNAILNMYRELPVVGGSGVFRLARGVVTYQTYFYNTTSFDATVEVDIVVFHY